MSHEKIKNITISKDFKTYKINSACNNVFPKTYTTSKPININNLYYNIYSANFNISAKSKNLNTSIIYYLVNNYEKTQWNDKNITYYDFYNIINHYKNKENFKKEFTKMDKKH